ncbi:hypothetical protein AXG93_2528s2280 [Marchantia polymorpha subsp. ruderalis]|uniref:Uncharacterized protein n=1 Tax=Marchantia polymorpha subsp. ruderalis TaxID=1480154 RepID=A0A176WP74_MARPO|nr:hypothetical protein AXG93_2528s2280 [Marchantia polymorpha subsp. ruderalis]
MEGLEAAVVSRQAGGDWLTSAKAQGRIPSRGTRHKFLANQPVPQRSSRRVSQRCVVEVAPNARSASQNSCVRTEKTNRLLVSDRTTKLGTPLVPSLLGPTDAAPDLWQAKSKDPFLVDAFPGSKGVQGSEEDADEDVIKRMKCRAEESIPRWNSLSNEVAGIPQPATDRITKNPIIGPQSKCENQDREASEDASSSATKSPATFNDAAIAVVCCSMGRKREIRSPLDTWNSRPRPKARPQVLLDRGIRRPLSAIALRELGVKFDRRHRGQSACMRSIHPPPPPNPAQRAMCLQTILWQMVDQGRAHIWLALLVTSGHARSRASERLDLKISCFVSSRVERIDDRRTGR